MENSVLSLEGEIEDSILEPQSARHHCFGHAGIMEQSLG
jgi:hypothetical protein